MHWQASSLLPGHLGPRLSIEVGLLFPFHMCTLSKRAVCGYSIAEVGLGPRTERSVWDWLAGVFPEQQGAVGRTWASESHHCSLPACQEENISF